MNDTRVHRRRFLAFLGVGAGATIASSALPGAAWAKEKEKEKEAPHFTYEGETRAELWGELAPEYETCSIGGEQTPINVATTDAASSTSALELRYQPVAASALNNGHTLQVVTEPGASIALDGAEYELVQFHYHTPSEHTYDGRPYLVEWHFVHQDADANTAVVGVMVNLGAEHEGFAPILAAAPAREGKTKKLPGTVDPSALLPSDRTAVGYDGSFTTPPCTEGVKWTLLTAPIEMSEAQVQELQNYLGPNARPLQPANGREVVTRSVT